MSKADLRDAQGWVREQGVSVDDDIAYRHEFEHLTLAGVLIARYKQDRDDRSVRDAVGLLERLLQAADRAGRTGSVIEILRLQALARQVTGDLPAALASLERALTLAEPEGYARVFLDEGQAMRDLLRHAAAAGIRSSYTRQLLAAFDKQGGVAPAPRQGTSPGIAEPLTAREVEVLRLRISGHDEPGDRGPAGGDPVHREAPHREQLWEIGCGPSHRGSRSSERAERPVGRRRSSTSRAFGWFGLFRRPLTISSTPTPMRLRRASAHPRGPQRGAWSLRYTLNYTPQDSPFGRGQCPCETAEWLLRRATEQPLVRQHSDWKAS